MPFLVVVLAYNRERSVLIHFGEAIDEISVRRVERALGHRQLPA
jgi:hypothetical protein